MDRVRFELMIAAYGAEPGRWPEPERVAALAFIAAEPAWTDALLERERVLDRALETAETAAPTPELLGRRILRAAPARQFGRSAFLALAACAAMGVFIGYGGGLSLAPVVTPGDATEDVFALAFEAPGELGDGDE